MSVTNKIALPPITISLDEFFKIIRSNVSGGEITANSLSDGIATLSNGRLLGILSPNEPFEAVNKQYVDLLGGDSTWKLPVLVATTENIGLSGLLIIDGTTLSQDDRVLVKDQTNSTENGIYTASSGTWVRSPDLTSGYEASGVAVIVSQGIQNNNKLFQCINFPGSDIVGTSSLTFTEFKGSPGGLDNTIQFNNSGILSGDSNLTWDGTTLNTNGIFTSTNTTNSTNTTTGSVVLSGGMGIAQNVQCGGTVTANQFISVSDAKLKKDVNPIQDPLQKLNLIDPVQYKFNFNDDENIHYGVLAQDLQEQGLGSMVQDVDGKLSVNYNDILGILVASVQELKTEIQKIKEKI